MILAIRSHEDTNPTLSANMSFFVFNQLAGYVGSWRACRLFFAMYLASNLLRVHEDGEDPVEVPAGSRPD
jgi:hypothetical protein